MSRRLLGNSLATLGAVLVGGAAAWFYHRQFEVGPLSWEVLRSRKLLLNWSTLVLAGLTVGVVIFFLIWGHFQKLPPAPPPGTSKG